MWWRHRSWASSRLRSCLLVFFPRRSAGSRQRGGSRRCDERVESRHLPEISKLGSVEFQRTYKPSIRRQQRAQYVRLKEGSIYRPPFLPPSPPSLSFPPLSLPVLSLPVTSCTPPPLPPLSFKHPSLPHPCSLPSRSLPLRSLRSHPLCLPSVPSFALSPAPLTARSPPPPSPHPLLAGWRLRSVGWRSRSVRWRQ